MEALEGSKASGSDPRSVDPVIARAEEEKRYSKDVRTQGSTNLFAVGAELWQQSVSLGFVDFLKM